MRNAGRLQQSRRHRAVVLGAAVTVVASLAFAMAPAGVAEPAQSVQSGRGAQLVTPGWPARPGMLRAGSNELQSVFCTSRANCWAVGLHAAKTGALVNRIVHWNGKNWSKVSAPSPGGTQNRDFSSLSAVRCTSAANCWAVGQDANRGQALHWNGTRWSVVPTPEPGTGPSGFTVLRDVACPSANSCWAAGLYGQDTSSSETSFDLALHWNGKKWFKVTTPNPAGTKANDLNDLDAIRCASPDDCWAAGTTGATDVLLNDMLHWNGRKWFTQKVPNPGGSTTGSYNAIYSLACTSTKNCWGVGEYGLTGASGYSLNQALHWNGRKWSHITTPNPNGTAMGATNTLNGVNCTATNYCWAVGYVGSNSSGGSQTGQALHWNGKKWTLIGTPNPAGTTNQARNLLNSVRCITANDCWIVGESQINGDPYVNLFLHWNGVKWSTH